MSITLPYKYTPREYQVPLCAALDKGYRRAVSVWHRRAGKDKTLINIMTKEMFKRVGVYYYFFPSYNQGRKILWDGVGRDGFPFTDHIPQGLRANTNNQEMKIKMVNGSLFQVVGSDKIDSLVGTNPVGCVYSEYALQKEEAWTFVKPILLENKGFAVFNYTPRGLTHGWKLYQHAQKDPSWFCELLTVEDTGVITPEEIQSERDEGMPESLIRQEYYCDFTASSDNVLIPLDLIIPAIGRQITRDMYEHAPRVLGVDVARFGDDSSAICRRQGLACTGISEHKRLGSLELAGVVSAEIEDFQPDAVFIDASPASNGVIDILRSQGYTIIDVHFGGRADYKARYVNKRTEMYDRARQWLHDGGVLPENKRLRLELSLTTYTYKGVDQIALTPKDILKKEMDCSPDLADAFVLTFAYPVRPKRQPGVFHHQETAPKMHYDVLPGMSSKNFVGDQYAT